MIGVILAAGKGRRLRPLTETRPKALLPILGKPLISYHISLLKRLNVEKIVVVVSYLKEQLIEKAKELANTLAIDIEFVDQKTELGTGHALKTVVEHYEDDMIVVYGDLYLDVDGVSKVLLDVVNRGDSYILGVEVDDVSRYGKLVTDDDTLMKIVEKPLERSRGLVNAGIYVLKAGIVKLVSNIGLSPRGEYELTDLVEIARGKGMKLKVARICDSCWQDIGYPWDLLRAVKLELSKYKEKIVCGKVDSSTTIRGTVIIEENASVKGSTYIEGPVYIGKNAVVGPNSYIRPFTAIEEGAHIGFAVEVKESIIFEKTHAAHLTYIGDSIIGEGVNLGAGTLIANLRFDGKTVKMNIDGVRIDTGRIKMGTVIGGYVKTGVNAAIMPGVKIGSYAIIYPGVVVYRDVPPNTIVDRDWR